jgi:hypothetical protein
MATGDQMPREDGSYAEPTRPGWWLWQHGDFRYAYFASRDPDGVLRHRDSEFSRWDDHKIAGYFPMHGALGPHDETDVARLSSELAAASQRAETAERERDEARRDAKTWQEQAERDYRARMGAEPKVITLETELSRLRAELARLREADKGEATERKAPPIGVMPRWLHEERRRKELSEAVTRFRQSQTPVPVEWLTEWAALSGYELHLKPLGESRP